jgi:hypothetical protein
VSAAKYDLNIARGADYTFTLRLLDINEDPVVLSGGSVAYKAEIREAHRKPLTAAFTITAVPDDIGGTVGDLLFSLDDTVTLTLDVNKKYQWDFFFTDVNGYVDRLLYGDVNVVPNITNI